MVLNLFIPPGEGQYMITPKRPDPLGANATLQYTVVGSTTLAATYTAFASSYVQRVHPTHSLSRTAIFIRSSARLGMWAGAVGAAVNWYYYKAFIGVLASEKNLNVSPRKLYAWTPRLTVDDGALAGAALGLAASIPTLFLRRPAVPRWTRCLGMTNIGACAGILGTHGYLQYNGERQKAYTRLEERKKQQSLEFWGIFWDKELMSRFNPLVQHYVRHQGIWHASNLPVDAFSQPPEHGNTLDSTIAAPSTEAPIQAQQPEQIAYYAPPFDYAEDLARYNVQSTLNRIAELENEKQVLLKEAEYLLFVNTQQRYQYCHSKGLDHDERQQHLQEMNIVEMAYDRLRFDACTIDIKLAKAHLFLQHRAITDAHPAADDKLESWLPKARTIDFKQHDPAMSLSEMEKFQAQIAAEVKMFEGYMVEPGRPAYAYERCRKDLEDGRVLLRAVDKVVWELEKARKESVGLRSVDNNTKADANAVLGPGDAAKTKGQEEAAAQVADTPKTEEKAAKQ